MDQSIIASLPPLAQFAINLAIFLVTIVIALKAYVNKKTITDNFLEDDERGDKQKKLYSILSNIADSLAEISETLTKIEEIFAKEVHVAENEREIQRRVEQKLKKGSKNSDSDDV